MLTGCHVVENFAEELAFELVDGVILVHDLTGSGFVFVQDRAEEAMAGERDALAEIDERGGQLGMNAARRERLVQANDDFCNRCGVIGSAFDVGVDFKDKREAAEVFGKWVKKREDFKALGFNRDFFAIDAIIRAPDFTRKVDVHALKGIEGALEHFDCER